MDFGNLRFSRTGQRRLEGPQTTFVDWKCVWNPSIWCWEWVLVVFCLFEGTFFWSSFFRKAYAWIFEIFRVLLGGSSAVAELFLDLRKSWRLALFCLNGLLSCPERIAKSFPHQLIFEKSSRNSKVRFPNCKIDKIWDFLGFGQMCLEGSQTTFVDWKCVWNPSIWCLEGSWYGFCWFETPFLWTTFIFYIYIYRRFWDFLRV